VEEFVWWLVEVVGFEWWLVEGEEAVWLLVEEDFVGNRSSMSNTIPI